MEDFRCPVCSEVFEGGGVREPVVLPQCGHTFCSPCLQQLQEDSTGAGAETNAAGRDRQGRGYEEAGEDHTSHVIIINGWSPGGLPQLQRSFRCPTCRRRHIGAPVDQLPTNFALLRLATTTRGQARKEVMG